MLDGKLRPLIDPPLNRMAKHLVKAGVKADILTGLGAVAAIFALIALCFQLYFVALLCIIGNRMLDGLDGSVARASTKNSEGTDRGAFLDICADFLLYGGVIFGFALGDPEQNALAAAFLLFSYISGSSTTFFAYAILAAKRGETTEDQGKKGFYYLAGLMEGTETIVAMCLMCLLPAQFPILAVIFGILCFATAIGRVVSAYHNFKE